MAGKTEQLRAVVVGGTGAVGREIVGQLLASPHWSEVVTVGRRAVEVPASYSGWDPAKLKQVVVDMDNLEAEAADAFRGADAAFCALGTTRAAAGSADAFRKVDVEYVEKAAKAAKAGGVPLFSLLTAQGANAKQWAPDWKPLHGLLYMRSKGLAEEAAKAQGFALGVSAFRPGMLERGELARGVERLFAKVLSSVPVADVAKVMIADAEQRLAGGATGERVLEMRDILAEAKEGGAA